MGAAEAFPFPQTTLHIDPFESVDSTVDRGLQRLAGAVLIQALDDLNRGPRRAREQAREWIFAGSLGDFNFDLCCSLLGRAPEDVRRRLRRYHILPAAPVETSHPFRSSTPINYLPE